MKTLFFVWLFIAILFIVIVENQTHGSHYQGAGYLITVMYSVPFWAIVLLIYFLRKRNKGWILRLISSQSTSPVFWDVDFVEEKVSTHHCNVYQLLLSVIVMFMICLKTSFYYQIQNYLYSFLNRTIGFSFAVRHPW